MHAKEDWEIEKERLLLQKKKQRLIETLPNEPHRKGWVERGADFNEGNYFIHPSTQELWLAVGTFSPTWGTEVHIYSSSIGRLIQEWDEQLAELHEPYQLSGEQT
ncbi:hypothetical protein [Ammoniphilus sp. CFH 90114]|uniref:hypothetical protein n=1 Tax=Ammoniphilus sp. CFH 90114 TaxID=2493665 RepID=UPI0013E98F38|nr:hypothetical protein [Ammoniphilus sp. CFH 90114]